MALLSDDAVFYLQVGTLWMLSATAAVTILRGWIRGHGFHPKTSHLFVLGYSLVLAQDALRLLLVHGNIPKSYRCRRCPGDASVPAVGECILLAGVYVRDLAQVADRCYTMMLIAAVFLGDAVWGERMPPRPSVPERRGLSKVGGIVIEILIFISCVLSCIHGLPVLLQDYMAATVSGRDAAVA